MKHTFDYLVIGGGSGGIASARRAAQHGARVGLIESGRLGGTCVNVGCVPKKVMWHAGMLADAIDDARGYGFDVRLDGHDWAALVARREAYLRRLNGIYQRNLDKDKVQLVEGLAHFEDPFTVRVGEQTCSADHILIATGGESVRPDIPGQELGLCSDGFFALNERPRRVVLVGSGYIAVELAGVLQALGSEVHLVIRHDTVLRHFDTWIADILMEHMQALGIRVHAFTQAQAVHAEGQTRRIELDNGESIVADALIWAIGRQPKVAALNLSAAGVDCDAQGHVLVDEAQTSSQRHIFAVGDVTRTPALTPVAIKAGRLLADRLFGGGQAVLDVEHLPSVIFSHPAIGTIGLSEAAARARYDDVRVYQGRFTALYHALTEHKAPSAVKMVVAGPEERVVGLHGIGPGVDEMMQGFAVAMRMGATKADFDATIAIHPSGAEEFVTLR